MLNFIRSTTLKYIEFAHRKAVHNSGNLRQRQATIKLALTRGPMSATSVDVRTGLAVVSWARRSTHQTPSATT